jgi:transcriptional regulator with XRE-family HTH domain
MIEKREFGRTSIVMLSKNMNTLSGPPSAVEERRYRLDPGCLPAHVAGGKGGAVQRNARALGAFIRACRERLSPTVVGLEPGQHRRTPGLRRQEVAMLCGLSTAWYTWIEQGRPVSASAGTFVRIADALQLSSAERSYLFDLAGKRDPVKPCQVSGGMPEILALTVNALRTPAYVLDQHWAAVAWNGLAADLFVGWLDGEHDRNLLSYMFLSCVAREIIIDWHAHARSLVAEVRAEAIRYADSAPIWSTIDVLKGESEDFCRLWESLHVEEHSVRTLEFDHPRAGKVACQQVSLEPIGRRDMKLVSLMPEECD